MPVETFNFIDSLNTANPTATDNVSEGDDHIRGIKTTLKNTFPNVNGAVNPTDEELNYVDGVTSNIQTQLDGKQATLGAGDITATEIAADAVGASELNVVGNGTAGQYLASDGDGTMTWTTLSSDPTMGGDLSGTASNAQIVANAVNANELNVVGNGTSGQMLTSDGDGSMTWANQPASGNTVTVGQVSTNFSTSDSTKLYTLNMQTSGLNFYPSAVMNASTSSQTPIHLDLIGTAPVARDSHCNNTSQPTADYQSKVFYYQNFTNGSFNCTKAQVKYSYIVIS